MSPRGGWRALRPADAVRVGGLPISVLALGRYRSAREATPPRRPGRLRVEFSTVHAAKGREAAYVVVLDLRDARRGFPPQVEDDPPPPSCAATVWALRFYRAPSFVAFTAPSDGARDGDDNAAFFGPAERAVH